MFITLFLFFSAYSEKALNATLAVQRLKSRQCQSEAEQSTVLVNQVLNPEPSPARSGNVAQPDAFKCSLNVHREIYEPNGPTYLNKETFLKVSQ